MSLNKIFKFFRTIAFRLTLWYAGIFLLSTSIAIFYIFYFTTSFIRNKVDQSLIETTRTFHLLLKNEGLNAVINNAIEETRAAGEKKIFFRFLHSNGELFSSSNMTYWKDIAINLHATQSLINGSPLFFETVKLTKRKNEVRILYVLLNKNNIIQLGISMEYYTRVLEAFRRTIFTILISILVFSALIGWFMAKRALAGVGEVTRIARDINLGSLDKRVPLKKTGDEIDQLCLTFNQMLDRIQHLITGIKEMSDNIAHDLRSPITKIRGAAEVALTTNSSFDEYKNIAASTIEECDMLLSIINTMLYISKTEAGIDGNNFEPINISKIADDACNLFQSSALDKCLTLKCLTSQNVLVSGDTRMIQRMIANLLDNAIKYSKKKGEIKLSIHLDNTHKKVTLSVKDMGIGISEKDLSHIFQRFYRCDPSRSEAGSGLGLSLVQAILTAHKGSISVVSRINEGSTFSIILPGL